MGLENLSEREMSKNRRVMIVDDEKDFGTSLSDILESYGYHVEIAHDEKSAMEKLNDFDAHVILLDLRLGHENGIHLINKFKKACPGHLTVIMTAYAATDTAIKALKEGAYDYLRKPLDPNDLLATLDRCFEKINLEREKSLVEASLQKRNKELEEINARLKESEERYRLLVETMNDGLSMMDENGITTYVNDKLCEMTGFPCEEFKGRPLTHFLDDKNRKIYNKQWEKHLRGECDSYELEFIKKDGSVLPSIASPQVITGQDGQFKGSFVVITDISERKEAEKERIIIETQLQQAQKMEGIGTLAGGIAHDFNNSLQGILGYTQMLLIDKNENDPDRSRLLQIEKAAQQSSELIQQLLTFSRKVESQMRPLDLNQEIRQVEGLLKRTIPKMINIMLRLEKNLPVISADPTQMEQIIMNLAVNARDAMEEAGTITIETSHVKLSEDYCRTHLEAVPGHYVLLMVSDTGHGMNQETVDRIFEPFFTTKELGKGTGLGLSMVYGLVQKHKGYITCYSEPGSGTCFKIYIPVIEEIPSRTTDTPIDIKAENLPRGEETILLVDDDSLVRSLGEQILIKFGYNVITAENGEKALEIYSDKGREISLVILDLIMPGMGGKLCLEKLLQMDHEVKIIIASGYSANGNAKSAMDAGAKGFVTKPFDINQMLITVRNVLDKEI